MFAIIRTGGKQYRVVANDLIRIEKLPGEAGSTIAFDDILVVGNGETSTLGSPTVSGGRCQAMCARSWRPSPRA